MSTPRVPAWRVATTWSEHGERPEGQELWHLRTKRLARCSTKGTCLRAQESNNLEHGGARGVGPPDSGATRGKWLSVSAGQACEGAEQ